MGRPTKLTPRLQESIAQAVSLGVPVVSAGLYAGVSKACILQWLQRGQGTHPDRPQDHRLLRTVFPPQLHRAARLTAPLAPVARAWRAGLGHASARRCSDPAPDHAAQ